MDRHAEIEVAYCTDGFSICHEIQNIELIESYNASTLPYYCICRCTDGVVVMSWVGDEEIIARFREGDTE